MIFAHCGGGGKRKAILQLIHNNLFDKDHRGGVASHEACAAMCASEESCQRWSFDLVEKACSLRYCSGIRLNWDQFRNLLTVDPIIGKMAQK